uniref:Uncharacterized protein n=1 Tax=Siphoviridae sp. ctnPP24 TaxID=2825662 RepID=A0A8S5TYT4_9CAUD|nr:MAG TPA: hypothetical protein [Siphoviridae sp. ctnPP24]
MLLTDERRKQLNIPWSTEIDLINVTYKNLFEAAGNDVDTIKERFIEYLALIYQTYGKDTCAVPVEYLNYVTSMCSPNFDYRDFRHTLGEFQSRYSVIVHECNTMKDWCLDHLLIQEY